MSTTFDNLFSGAFVQSDNLAEWTPISLRWERSGPVVDWRRMNARRFVEPLFDQTIHKHQQEMPCANLTTPAETLLTHTVPARPPTGFIFHASRCGSTLVAQMLASLPQNIVLSEPAIVNQVLYPKSSDSPVTEADQAHLLRAVIGALGRPRHGDEQQCFIKFSSSAIAKMPLIRRVFPDVPWIFLYREPLEIVGSYVRFAADRLPPGIADTGLVEGDPAELAEMRPEEFWARVLAARFSEALKFYQPGQTLLMNYAQLPEAALGPMLEFLSAACSPEDVEHMRKAALWNAKEPSKKFHNDSNQKRHAVPMSAHALVERLVLPLYLSLESIRTARPSRTEPKFT
ncbi:MAG TPA: sulfotransferase [Terriglobales bacterium]|nr:sulfotransferase [Terriglobales bacterium]